METLPHGTSRFRSSSKDGTAGVVDPSSSTSDFPVFAASWTLCTRPSETVHWDQFKRQGPRGARPRTRSGESSSHRSGPGSRTALILVFISRFLGGVHRPQQLRSAVAQGVMCANLIVNFLYRRAVVHPWAAACGRLLIGADVVAAGGLIFFRRFARGGDPLPLREVETFVFGPHAARIKPDDPRAAWAMALYVFPVRRPRSSC